MRIRVFVTDDRTNSSPLLFVPDGPGAYMPPHPRSRAWRYFATVGAGDKLVRAEGNILPEALKTFGFYLANRHV